MGDEVGEAGQEVYAFLTEVMDRVGASPDPPAKLLTAVNARGNEILGRELGK